MNRSILGAVPQRPHADIAEILVGGGRGGTESVHIKVLLEESSGKEWWLRL